MMKKFFLIFIFAMTFFVLINNQNKVFAATYEKYITLEPDYVEKGPIISSTGEMIQGHTSKTVTYTYENVDLSSGKIKVSGRLGTNEDMHLIAFFDKEDKLITTLLQSTGTEYYYEDYLIENVSFDWKEVYKVKLSSAHETILPELKVMYYDESDVIYPEHTFDKTVAVFGGSISTPTYNSTIAQNIWIEKCGFKSIDNYGVPGMGFVYGNQNIPRQVEKAISTKTYDYYILWCSTNDYRKGIPAGDVNDNPKTLDEIKTQTGGINYSIRRIYESNPNAKIILFTSLKCFVTSSPVYPDLGDSCYNPYSEYGAYDNKNFYYFTQMQIKCCIKYGISYLDMFNQSGINEYNYSKYIKSDKKHLTDYGYEEVGKLQANFLINGLSIGSDINNEIYVLSIEKTNSEGLVDTYTIKYTDGSITTFTVTSGKDGVDGVQGIQGMPGKDGHTPVITIVEGYWYIDGVNTNVLAEGLKGETGNGISSIKLTSSEGLVDTYTIYFTDGSTTTFTITNGKNGIQGTDGNTPILRINSETNEWEVSYDNGTTWDNLNIKATNEENNILSYMGIISGCCGSLCSIGILVYFIFKKRKI